MYWTLELASYLSDAPWPATRKRSSIMRSVQELLWKWWRISKPLRTKEKYMNPLRRFGLIIPLKKIIFGTKMNINLIKR